MTGQRDREGTFRIPWQEMQKEKTEYWGRRITSPENYKTERQRDCHHVQVWDKAPGWLQA